ncbi:MAG TPA: GMC family oxidoreductase [Steroidobacteraceae bacterium]|jgi:choline dehydrogenase-like flavoprotein|nr:GMC family oxidoreductase [Steroidobacteraceae bacterium]
MAKFDLNDDGVVVIVGSGAGGGTLAHELTRRGIKVVLLEAGKRQSLATFSQDPNVAFAQLTWLDPRTTSGTATVFQDYPTLPSWTAKTVGGTTVHWTGATPRVRPWEMKTRTTYGELKGASCLDWPIEFEELKRYYQLAEKRMVVTRRNGNPGLPASNHFKVLYNGAKKIGYKRVHTNYMAINTRPADGRAFCIQQGFCVQGCKTGAKWSTLYTEIPRAEATGKLDLRTECMATRIEHGPDGLVNGVVYRDSQGKEQRQKARIVCVACNAVETPRLLLMSESGKFPQGLANSHDQVGRHYSHHVGGFVWGIFDKPIHMWRGTTLAGIVEDETINDPKRGFVGGYHLEMAALDLPSLPLAGLPYNWGRDFASIMEHYRSMAGIFINGEDIPRATNRITLNRDVKDAYGLPVPNIHIDEHENNGAMRAHAQKQAKALYEAVGAKRVVHTRQTPSTHNMCTARMSKDPRDGVTNAHGQTHDIKNLFISDGSAMTTPSSANPTLTIVALALRQAEFISREMAARNI